MKTQPEVVVSVTVPENKKAQVLLIKTTQAATPLALCRGVLHALIPGKQKSKNIV